jgi:hypothetical protein
MHPQVDHSITQKLPIYHLLAMHTKGSVLLSPSHPLVPACFLASIFGWKPVALFGTQIHQKSDEVKISFQNVPHPIFTDNFRVSTTLKPITSLPF